jgi:DedD protein
MSDEGFREIQLSGKQLIALFMTAAVVLIATFLSGVLVGRGVRAQVEPATSADAVQAAPGALDPTASPAASKPAPESEPPPLAVQSAVPPPQPEESPDLYARGKATAAPAPDPTPKGASAAGAAPVGGEPAGTGYYVKVVAYNGKAQADKVAGRLSVKGYSAYVVPVTGKGKALYSVRVGKFATRTEADAVKRRLEQEEQFKPSIAR